MGQGDRIGLTAPVVVALSMGLVALQAPDGRTEVRDLETGKVAWRAADPAIPLAFDGKRLVIASLTAPTRVLAFDAQTGAGPQLRSKPVGVPGWRTQTTRVGVTTTSLQMAHWVKDRDLVVAWNRSSLRMSGMARPRLPPEYGLVLVNLDTGEVRSPPPAAGTHFTYPAPSPAQPPGVLQPHGSAAKYRVGSAGAPLHDALFTGGRHGISLEFVRRSPSELELWMQRYDPKTLNKRDRLHLRTGNLPRNPWISRDGRYVLVTEVTGRNRQEVQALSLETGRPAARLPMTHRMWDEGPLVLLQHKAPSELVVQELATGRRRWSAPIHPDPAPPKPMRAPPP